jgi:hypothetical protein
MEIVRISRVAPTESSMTMSTKTQPSMKLFAVGVAAVLVLVITGFRWVAVVLVVLGGAAALWGIEAARRTARLPGKDRAPDGQR